jgi:hypothetical protein
MIFPSSGVQFNRNPKASATDLRRDKFVLPLKIKTGREGWRGFVSETGVSGGFD